MMDCRKRCGCRNKYSWRAERSCRAPERNMRMGAADFWERLKPADGAEQKGQEGPVGTWIARLKKGLAAIAAAKSLQQIGREEEPKEGIAEDVGACASLECREEPLGGRRHRA